MTKLSEYDAIVVGSGPNGLAAAIRLAQEKLSVLVIEGKETIGGGARTAELTLPGFHHDVCSTIHPLAAGCPFFLSLPLQEHRLTWIQPQAPLAHPFKEGSCIVMSKSIEETCTYLGQDGKAYAKLMQPFVDQWLELLNDVLAPIHIPEYPWKMAKLAYYGIPSAEATINKHFKDRNARALFAGLAAHAILPLDFNLTSAFAMVLAISGHAIGWPMPKGGAQQLTNALASYFQSLGGEIQTGMMIERLEQLPKAKVILLDTAPNQLFKLVKDLPVSYIDQLKKYRYGPGVFKIDWALNHPIPWKNADCAKAGTVHLGGTFEQIAASEKTVWNHSISENNFMLITQPTLFDPERAPEGKHIAWGYCHVPNGSEVDMTEQMEKQIEEYAPGFRECIIGRKTHNCVQMERYDPNYVGGDINGGSADIEQFIRRPTSVICPYSTPIKNLYLCSASTPPGGGVHGMCGFHAAEAALKQHFK